MVRSKSFFVNWTKYLRGSRSEESMKILYEVTPPSKRATRHELDYVVKNASSCGANEVDVTDSPTGESHSSSVAACVYIKTKYSLPVMCHIRTRDITLNALRGMVRACAVWEIEHILLVMGEGGENTGLTPTHALRVIREEKLLEGSTTKVGFVLQKGKSVEKKIRAKPDFLYTSPLTSVEELEWAVELSRSQNFELFPSLIVPSKKNEVILKRIGLQALSAERALTLATHALRLTSNLVVISPADPDEGFSFLKRLNRNGL